MTFRLRDDAYHEAGVMPGPRYFNLLGQRHTYVVPPQYRALCCEGQDGDCDCSIEVDEDDGMGGRAFKRCGGVVHTQEGRPGERPVGLCERCDVHQSTQDKAAAGDGVDDCGAIVTTYLDANHDEVVLRCTNFEGHTGVCEYAQPAWRTSVNDVIVQYVEPIPEWMRKAQP